MACGARTMRKQGDMERWMVVPFLMQVHETCQAAQGETTFSAAMAAGPLVAPRGNIQGQDTSNTPANAPIEDPMQELARRIEFLERLNMPAQVFDVA